MRTTSGYRSRPSATRALGAPALLALLLAGYLLGCSRMSAAEKDLQVGLRLMNPSFELTDDRREALVEELGLPAEIRDKDEVIRYFMTRAAKASEEYRGAYYFLGLHFLSVDCEQGKTYIRQYLDDNEDDDAEAVFRVATDQGCEAAIELVQEQMSGSDG